MARFGATSPELATNCGRAAAGNFQLPRKTLEQWGESRRQQLVETLFAEFFRTDFPGRWELEVGS
jgi:hypothetical protein